ncbi:MAG: ABC transporter permease [Beijerinckiaceae bacterium]|jgi:ABC-type dipeptide/oligopeptide/nickel transport system permease component|nr:ABC transporter permease [Beijerinckiaceae bacterium]
MVRAIAWRVAGVVPVLFLVTLVLFLLLRLAPGDAADLLVPDDASEAEILRIRERWGLDRPLLEQYFSFLLNLLKLDLGRSYRYGADVFELIASRVPATIELATLALLAASLIAIPLGILAALRKGTAVDGAVSVFAIAGVSTPTFWLGILLVLLFSAELHLLPSGGRLPYGVQLPERTGLHLVDAMLAGRFDLLGLIASQLILPVMTLAFSMVGIISRITRGAIIDVAQEEFITTSVAKGLTRGAIIRHHLLPNATVPITTILGLELGVLISGSIIVEVVFSWPGLGTLLYQSISVRDIPLVTGIVVTYTTLFILINVVIDVIYFIIDPRIRASQGA